MHHSAKTNEWRFDPGHVVLGGGFVIGLLSIYVPTMGLGWLLGLGVGLWYTIVETNKTPKNLRRRIFTQYVGSGRYGTPFVHDSRVIAVFASAFAGLIAELIGVLLVWLLGLSR